MEQRRIDYLPLDEVKPAARNPRRHNLEGVRASISRFGYATPALRDERTGRLVAGHGRTLALAAMRDAGEDPPAGVKVDGSGAWLVPVVCGWQSHSDAEADAYLVADNRWTEKAGWDDDGLAALLASIAEVDPALIAAAGFDDDEVAALLAATPGGDGSGALDDGAADTGEARRSLAERFGVPPFTLLDARQGYWQTRKKAWLALGLQSEVGRDAGMVGGFANASQVKASLDGTEFHGTGQQAGTSIFDPVLCELLVRWYSAPGQAVLDPFAGGSVRGLVSARLGRDYAGVDLRTEQVDANARQAKEWSGRGLVDVPESGSDLGLPLPRWIVGDSRMLRELVPPSESFDLLLTCPPYFDLEQYSDDPADLSRAASYDAFLVDYRDCLAAATDRMAEDAFAAVVTGAIRDRNGHVLDLPADTTRIMEGLGWRLYQDAVLATPPGTAAIRAARGFVALRKLVRVHQMVSVYHRGDIKAVRDWPSVEAGEVADVDTEGGASLEDID